MKSSPGPCGIGNREQGKPLGDPIPYWLGKAAPKRRFQPLARPSVDDARLGAIATRVGTLKDLIHLGMPTGLTRLVGQ